MTASRGRSIFLIREQDPLKQGLKLEVDEETIIKEITCSNIREQDPLKQGLKLSLSRLSPYVLDIFASKIH